MILDEIKVQKEKEFSTNLWIHLSSPIYSQSTKPWCTSLVMASEGPPFMLPWKGVVWGMGTKELWLATFKRQ